MGWFGKLANVATGGLLGMGKGIARGDMKAIASGGMLGSRPGGGPGGGPSQDPWAGVSAEALQSLAGLSPEDRDTIVRGSIGNGGIEGWYQGGRAAGVPAPGGIGGAAPGMAAAAGALGQMMGNMNGMQIANMKPAAAPAAPAPTDYKALAEQKKANQAKRAAFAAKRSGAPTVPEMADSLSRPAPITPGQGMPPKAPGPKPPGGPSGPRLPEMGPGKPPIMT